MKQVILFVCVVAAVTPAVAAVSFEQAVDAWIEGAVSTHGTVTVDCYDLRGVQGRTLAWNWRADVLVSEIGRSGLGGKMVNALAAVSRDTVRQTAQMDPVFATAVYHNAIRQNIGLLAPLRGEIAAAVVRAGFQPDADLASALSSVPVPTQMTKCSSGPCDCGTCAAAAEGGKCSCLTAHYDDPKNPTLLTSCEKPRSDCDSVDWGEPMRDGPLPLPLSGLSASAGGAAN